MSAARGAAPLEEAERIGRRLVEEAIWWGDRCTWTGDAVETTDHGWEVVHRSLGADLYDGTAGVAWFLGHLWRARGDPDLRRTAEGALRHALSAPGRDGGLYVGPLGVALAAAEVGEMLGVSELAASGRELGGALAAKDGGAPLAEAELLGGAAGRLAALLGLAARSADRGLLDLARSLGDQLVEAAAPAAAGRCWPAPGGMADPQLGLCGLAHGAAGVAYALGELYAATGEPSYLEAARLACRYERSWYASGLGWPDLRSPHPEEPAGAPWPSYPAYWCHGAVGIGLQRLRMHELTGDRVALAEAGAALVAARSAARGALAAGADGFAANFSLCHGLGGIVDLETEAAVVLDSPAHLDAARALAAAGARGRDARGGWGCGVLGGGETGGLMLGLAGIGHCHLRLHDRTVPSTGLLVRWPKGSRPEQSPGPGVPAASAR